MRGNPSMGSNPIKNLLHQRFGKLTAIGVAGRDRAVRVLWLWRCQCGRLLIARGDHVQAGWTQSCGCIRRNAAPTDKHYRRPEYSIWGNIVQRCTNPNNRLYKYYGGRGITVCDRWRKSFDSFFADMGERPQGLSVERVDNNKGYSPENCKWATMTEQANNTRHNALHTLGNKTQSVAMWAREAAMPYSRLHMRLSRGVSLERALTNPMRPK